MVIAYWVVIFTVALVISFYAAPEKEYGITRYKGIEVRDYWASPLTDYLYALSIVVNSVV